ncbi:MAG TPA: relaxase, partial [Porphyromonadaceae bacterium]|nr:relaxase [Porphyromonadaceae bacterium]
KISLGNSLYRALVYNSEKINKEDGRLLATNKIYNDGTGRVNINRAYQ